MILAKGEIVERVVTYVIKSIVEGDSDDDSGGASSGGGSSAPSKDSNLPIKRERK